MITPGRVEFLGCPLDLVDRDALLRRAEAASCGKGPRLRIEGLNVAKLVDARRFPPLMDALRDAEVVHTDGVGIALGVALLRGRATRFAGVDLMRSLCDMASRSGAGIYLLGARPDVVAEAATRLKAAYPTLAIAGHRDGYFTPDEQPDVVAAIRASGAAYLFVGISSPKKELFLRQHWAGLGVPVAMGVGGSFDIVSGRLPRAPQWMQRAGCEWLFRMMLEPRRLGGRYLRTNTAYLWLLVRACLGLMPRQTS